MKTKLTLVVMLCFAFAFSQTTVKGKVTDDTGQPLPGANIIIMGTTIGTSSDFNGEYTLTTDQAPPFTICHWLAMGMPC